MNMSCEISQTPPRSAHVHALTAAARANRRSPAAYAHGGYAFVGPDHSPGSGVATERSPVTR